MQRLGFKALTLSANVNVSYRGQQKIAINTHSNKAKNSVVSVSWVMRIGMEGIAPI
jgi:hypothetical protein